MESQELDSFLDHSGMPYTKKVRPSYESFVAECPWCGQENTFNRRTDHDCTFVRMRALFLRQLLSGISPKSLLEAESAIAALGNRLREPTPEELEAHPDKQLVALLKSVKEIKINNLRNQVVHKHAYRPTRYEAEAALEESRSVLFPLGHRLHLHDEINWYVSLKKRDSL
ncbi:MAG: hypothetical protein EXQ56_01035 [Acidobacteria bacterium]|nr:hypothetical protein [Acidobacteriota bacterium]